MATYTIGPSACTGTAPTGYHEFSGKIILNETVNEASNKSVIAWSFVVYVNRAAYITGYTQSSGNYVQVTINGVNVFPQRDIGRVSLGDGTQAGTHYESNPVTLASGTLDVPHDSDGTKTIMVSATYSNSRSTATYLQSISVSGSQVLTTIHRAATITSAPDVTLTSATQMTMQTISWTDTESRYYKLICKYGNTVLLESNVVNLSPVIWGIPASVATYAPNSKSMVVTVVLQTFSDSGGVNLLGTDTDTFTITFDDTAFAPAFAPFTTSATWSSLLSGTKVAGVSYASVSWNGYGIQGATIVSKEVYYIDANNNEMIPRVSGDSPATLPVVPAFSDTSKQIRIRITLTDSRGYTNSATISAETVYGWTAPSITALTAVRCTSDGTESMTGSYYKLSVTYDIRPLNNSNAKNMAVKYKYQSASSYTQSSSGAVTNYSGTLSLGPYTLSSAQDEKLEVLVEVWDSYSSSNRTSMSVVILPASVFMDIMTSSDTKIGLGIGMVSGKANTVQLGWDLEIHDKVLRLYDDNGTKRCQLDYSSGLSFFNSSGSLIFNYPVTGISGGGAYDITSTDNGDGTQSLAIVDASGDGAYNIISTDNGDGTQSLTIVDA